MSATETDKAQAPAWWAKIKLCHLMPYDGGDVALCGEAGLGGNPHGPYDGEAMCGDCGRPVCPRCAQLDALENELDA